MSGRLLHEGPSEGGQPNTFRGTQQGETQGIPPTGKRVTVPGIFICRCAGGKIVEEWDIWDDLGLLQQLGVSE